MVLLLVAATSSIDARTTLRASNAGTIVDAMPCDGTFESVSSKEATIIEAFHSETRGLARGIIKVELKSLPQISRANELFDARLCLTTAGGLGSPATVQVLGFPTTDGLSADDAMVQATVIDTFTVPAGIMTHKIDVTTYLTSLVIESDATHMGIRLQLADEKAAPPVMLTFGLRDTMGESHPRLEVDVRRPVPEPSTLGLIGFGIVVVVFGLRQRREKS